MIKKSIKKVVGNLGYTINKKSQEKQPVVSIAENNPFTGYDYAVEGNEAVKLVQDYSMLPPINLFTLFEQSVYCEKEGISGAYVECGVWKGGAVGIMAKANLQFGSSRRDLHLFDIFDNICPPDASVDGVKAIEDTKRVTGFTDLNNMLGQLESIEGAYDSLGGNGTIRICKELLEGVIQYPSEYIHYHEGWFQDTLPKDKHDIDSIAILRLDGDWYASIKVCLENLYDKVATGGLIVIDDYGLYEGCTKAVNEFLKQRNIKTFLSYSRVNCRYFVKP